MRRRTLPLAAAVLVLATACSDDAVTITEATVTTAAATTTTTPSTRPAIPVDPALVPEEGDPDLLAAMVFFPGELPPPYDELALDAKDSGYAPAGGSLASALDPADEADDIVRFGQVAEFSTAFGDPGAVGIAWNAAQFATPEGAQAYLEDWVEDLRSNAESQATDRFKLEDFESSELEQFGDYGLRIGYNSRLILNDGTVRDRPGGSVAVRSGSLILWLWGNGPQAEQILDDLGRATADRVEGVASGSIPPRDHTALGLTDPPTLALDSFAFLYEYGIEAAEGGFSVRITGEFEAPNRASCRTTATFAGFEPVDSYVIVDGTTVWLGDLTGYEQLLLRDPAALNALKSCPGHPNHWELTKLHRIDLPNGEEVSVSGVEAFRADLTDYPQAMLDAGFVEAELAEFERYVLTVAADGGWPIGLDVERSIPLAAARRMYGLPLEDIVLPTARATVFERLTLTHINDPAIRVELPLLAG